MGLRRGELALASLRGYGRRQLWFLGMLEPLLILAAATPCGVVLGLPHLALPRPPLAGARPAGAVRPGQRRGRRRGGPRDRRGGGGRRPRRRERAAQCADRRRTTARAGRPGDAGHPAGAGRGGAGHAWSPRGAGAGRRRRTRPTWPSRCCWRSRSVCSAACSWWGWRGSGCGGRRGAAALSSYVASRTVRRRREGTLVILPVTAALTVAVFTVGVVVGGVDVAGQRGGDRGRGAAVLLDVAVALARRGPHPRDRPAGTMVDGCGRQLPQR